MARGFTLIELAIVIVVAAVLLAAALPRLRPALDRMATEAAARDVTTALAVTRHTAIARGQRARLVIAADSLRLDLWTGAAWTGASRWPGPAAHRVSLQVSNPVVAFSPIGVGWGAANTTITLRRGSQVETITTSRVGRVRRS
ncbi:MAG TPA: prepilin-type N-terminal cleavage/methylation domain-containing protein [Gemmatimonadales bacterium]|jgi:prepilin-type N-terminal cleavage/methylation domain-containing protein|nr:prepilin-type N-terminal cleavage/methylation domain-containing protein [Gemmatimonadales bacterium]